MAFSRTARKALREGRKGCASADSYLGLLQAGGRAYRAGLAIEANPYPASTEDAEVWAEGWRDEADAK